MRIRKRGEEKKIIIKKKKLVLPLTRVNLLLEIGTYTCIHKKIMVNLDTMDESLFFFLSKWMKA